MKNKNKTIVEPKKGSISKKIGIFAIATVLYVAIILTMIFVVCTISVFVNADSIGGGVVYSNPYTYSSMIIDTNYGTYCVGSNDYFTNPSTSENNISFDDYYSVLSEEEEMYFYVNDTYTDTLSTFLLPEENISFSDLVLEYGEPYTSGNMNYYIYYSNNNSKILVCTDFNINVNGIVTIADSISRLPGLQLSGVKTQTTIINDYTYTYSSYSGGGVDDIPGTEEPGTDNEYWRPTDQPGAYSLNNRAVSDSPISIKRLNTATYNSNGNYYSIFSEITSQNIIGFRFNFTKDIAVTYAQLSNNDFYYNYSMTNDFSITKTYRLLYYDIDGNLQSQEITSVISYGAGDTGTLLPTLSEIEINIGEDTMGLQDIYLVQDLYVSTNSAILSDTDYVHMFEWLAYTPTRTEQITNDYVNNFYRTTKIDIGEILLNSVNSFLGFELIPGFSLLSLLALVIGIPLLIYILKLFLGG